MKPTKPRRRQARVVGGRQALPSCVVKEIWAAVDRDALRFNVSRSFVIATALAEAMGIALLEDYREPQRRRAKVVNVVARGAKLRRVG
jgi:hypothetical protein